MAFYGIYSDPVICCQLRHSGFAYEGIQSSVWAMRSPHTRRSSSLGLCDELLMPANEPEELLREG